jgi:hypothetical protein
VTRIYLPPDANCLLSVANHCLRICNYVNVIVADKQPHLQYLSMDDAIKHCTKGAGIWQWASSDQDSEPDFVMASCGDIATMEALAATAMLRQMLTILGGLAEFERELIRARTGEGRKRAKERGVRFGRPRKMTPHQRQEALQRLHVGETMAEVARTYNVDATTIGRLAASSPLSTARSPCEARQTLAAFALVGIRAGDPVSGCDTPR